MNLKCNNELSNLIQWHISFALTFHRTEWKIISNNFASFHLYIQHCHLVWKALFWPAILATVFLIVCSMLSEKDKKAKRQNDKMTKRQKDKKTKSQNEEMTIMTKKKNYKRPRPIGKFNIVMSGQFRTLAMFLKWSTFDKCFLLKGATQRIQTNGGSSAIFLFVSMVIKIFQWYVMAKTSQLCASYLIFHLVRVSGRLRLNGRGRRRKRNCARPEF